MASKSLNRVRVRRVNGQCGREAAAQTGRRKLRRTPRTEAESQALQDGHLCATTSRWLEDLNTKAMTKSGDKGTSLSVEARRRGQVKISEVGVPQPQQGNLLLQVVPLPGARGTRKLAYGKAVTLRKVNPRLDIVAEAGSRCVPW